MAKYVTMRVKIVREFDELERTTWGSKYLGVLGDADAPRYIWFDDEDVADVDDLFIEHLVHAYQINGQQDLDYAELFMEVSNEADRLLEGSVSHE